MRKKNFSFNSGSASLFSKLPPWLIFDPSRSYCLVPFLLKLLKASGLLDFWGSELWDGQGLWGGGDQHIRWMGGRLVESYLRHDGRQPLKYIQECKKARDASEWEILVREGTRQKKGLTRVKIATINLEMRWNSVRRNEMSLSDVKQYYKGWKAS